MPKECRICYGGTHVCAPYSPPETASGSSAWVDVGIDPYESEFVFAKFRNDVLLRKMIYAVAHDIFSLRENMIYSGKPEH